MPVNRFVVALKRLLPPLLPLLLLLAGLLAGIVSSRLQAQESLVSRPLAASVLSQDGRSAELYFTQLEQGSVGLVRLTAPDLTEARALFRDREYPFVEVPGDAWYSLIVADIDAQPRLYPLSLIMRQGEGELSTLEAQVEITSASFFRQSFSVAPDRAFLIDPEIERNEFARLSALMANPEAERLWSSEGFQLPIQAELTSAFGQYRVLNSTVQTRHTGWDQQAPVGTPVGAIGAGRVAFADRLDIRGNYILIDHGWGIYSGYAHLSQLNVERGQSVESGQIIGLSGNTGRSSGPHLHWEVAINGEWVDSIDFIGLWLP